MKIKPRKSADMREVAVKPINSRYSSYPSGGLTPQRLTAILREADEGDVYRQMELFEEIEEKDPHLYSQLQTRKNAVTGLDFEVVPYSDDPRDKAIAEFVGDQIKGIKNLEDVFLDLLDAIGKGISISEILWKYDGGSVGIDQIKWVNQKLIRWDNDDVMRLITSDDPLGIVIPDNKFIIHKYKAKSGHPSRAGILRIVAWMYLFKNYGIKDWVVFVEVFGLPLRLGKYAAGASKDDKDALWDALVKMGSDAAGMVPEGCTIEFVASDGAKGAASGIYDTLCRYMDEQVSKAILGQTLTSDSGGSYAQSKTHNDVRHDLTLADCKALAATIRDDLIRPLVLFNFGDDRRLPQIVFDCERSEDLVSLVGIYKDLIGVGVPIPLAHIRKKFGIPAPEDDEPVAKMPDAISAPVGYKMLANKTDLPAQPALHVSSVSSVSSSKNAQYQQRVDNLVDRGMDQSASMFETLFAPIRALAVDCDTLSELQNKLADQAVMDALFDGCVSDDLTNLLADAMLCGDIAGRLKEHG